MRKSLILYACFCSCLLCYEFPARSQNVQRNLSARIYGTCYDYNTSLRLAAKVYSIRGSIPLLLAECTEEGEFESVISDSVKEIAIKLDDYRPIVMPVSIGKSIPPHARFFIPDLAMSRSDTLPVSAQEDAIHSFFFNMIDSIDVQYKLTGLFSGETTQAYFTHKNLRSESQAIFLLSGKYTATVSTTSGEIINTEEIELKPGINFKSINVTRPIADKFEGLNSPSRQTNVDYLDYKNVYFERSSHELTEEARESLDSVAKILEHRKDSFVKIVGHVENIGRRDRNVILSEYRARAVAGYLQGKGIQSKRLVYTWKGPDSAIKIPGSHSQTMSNQRVEITIMPENYK